MDRFVRGAVVVIPFPFSDLSDAKKRPALIVAGPFGDDYILCQITSQTIRDNHAIIIDNGDFETGSLNQISNVRPNRIFTADRHIILYQIGQLKSDKMATILETITRLFQ